MWIVLWDSKSAWVGTFCQVWWSYEQCHRPKKQPNAAKTGIKSMHCSCGVNADANMG